MAVEAVAYARAGLIGNPSDGYFGKTISVIVRDFSARVTLLESERLEIVPSQQDRSTYRSLREMMRELRYTGYNGGVRLMQATIRQFVEYCDRNGHALHPGNFSLRYRTTIPRGVGLAGSSALVTATLRCLMNFYGVEIPKHDQPNLILSVETNELGIAAGLQDRVIQVYEGCMYMDFDERLMKANGHGNYERIPVEKLPKLFIAYLTELNEGSEVFHNNIRERWLKGEPDVVQAMKDFAGYAAAVRELLLADRGDEIGPILDQNFNRRRSIYQIARENIELVERARSAGAHCKFAGSGGAIIGTYEDDPMYDRIVGVFEGSPVAVIRPTIEAESPAHA